MSKKSMEEEDNIVDDTFWSLVPERKVREEKAKDLNPDEEKYYEMIKDKKRARYEALRKKAEEY
jgi:hypothetical protein